MKTAKIKSMILCYDLKCYEYQYVSKRNKKNFVKMEKKVKKNYQISKKSIYICVVFSRKGMGAEKCSIRKRKSR